MALADRVDHELLQVRREQDILRFNTRTLFHSDELDEYDTAYPLGLIKPDVFSANFRRYGSTSILQY